MLVIDQFMLGNEQFWGPIFKTGASLSDQLSRFGGQVEAVDSGTYQVLRDPRRKMMILSQELGEQDPDEIFEKVLLKLDSIHSEKTVFIDTRCVVFCDSSLLKDEQILVEFTRLRKEGKDKEARDFLRSKGAAVRYGFNPHGDELAIAQIDEPAVIALWPDISA